MKGNSGTLRCVAKSGYRIVILIGSIGISIDSANGGALPLRWTVSPTQSVLGPNARGPAVLKVGNEYRMWHDDWHTGAEDVVFNTSTDGISWGTSVFAYSPPSTNDATPDVVFRNGTYHMWVGGTLTGSPGVDYATSPSGLPNTWTHQGWIPSWYGSHSTLPTATGFEAWFAPQSNLDCFHYGTSTNGLNWAGPGCVFPSGPAGSFDDLIVSPSVLLMNGQYHMWYGNASGEGQPFHLAYQPVAKVSSALRSSERA